MSLLSRRASAWAICLGLNAASEPQPALAGPPAPPPTAMNRRIVEDAFARWSAGGSVVFDEILADHVVVEVSAFLDLAAYDDVLRRVHLPAPPAPGPARAPVNSPSHSQEQG